MKSNYQTKIIGLLFLSGGICFLGEQLGFWDVSIFFPGWWCVFLILPALFHMLENGIQFGNTTLFAIGVYLLLDANGWIHITLNFATIAALACILIGCKMILGSREHPRHRRDDISNTSNIHSTVLFGNRRLRSSGFINSIDAQCMFGTQYIDLSDADIRNMEYLYLNCVFGSIDLIVPEDMNYVVKKDTVLGSCMVQDEPIGKYDLYVDVSCVLGQVNLRKKRSEHIKEGEFKEK